MKHPLLIHKGAAVWRCATKAAGLSQRQIARALSVSQSHISKIANGLAVPSAPEWIEFAELTGAPLTSYRDGYIDSGFPVSLTHTAQVGEFVLPHHYANEQTSSVRIVRLYLRYLRRCLGTKTDPFIRELGIDPDYFVNFGHRFNLRVNFDILSYLIRERLLDRTSITTFTSPLSHPSFYGKLQSKFISATPLDRIQLFTELFNRFELNHDYRIEHRTPTYIDISVSPYKRVGELLNPELKDFFATYFQIAFRDIASVGRSHTQVIHSTTLEREYSPRRKCVYRVFAHD